MYHSIHIVTYAFGIFVQFIVPFKFPLKPSSKRYYALGYFLRAIWVVRLDGRLKPIRKAAEL